MEAASKYQADKLYDLAIANYADAKKELKTGDVLIGLAACYKAVREYDESIANYKEYLSMRPSDVRAIVDLANTYIEKGDRVASIDTAAIAIEKDSQNWAAYQIKASAELDLKRYQDCIASATSAISINPEASYSFYSRGVSKKELGIEGYEADLVAGERLLRAQGNSGLADIIKGMLGQ